MSTRYNTGNPIESTDVRDMYDNAKNFDEFGNSTENTFIDRLGVTRKTIHGINSEFNDEIIEMNSEFDSNQASMNAKFESHILSMGFTRVGTFAAGATLTNPRQTLLWDIADGGDGQEYGWSGAFPKVVPPLSTPNTTGGIAVGKWMSRFDPELRVQVRESLRRSYAEAGYNLVDGSFEAGGTLVNANDVLLQESTGKAFSGPAGTVSAGTDPVGSADWTPRNGKLLRSEFVNIIPEFTTVADMKAATIGANVRCRTLGYYAANDGGGAEYTISSTVITPDGYADHALQGGKFALLQTGGIANVLQCGAHRDGVTDSTNQFKSAKIHGNGFAFVPESSNPYVVTEEIGGGLYGFYPAKFIGLHFVQYLDLSLNQAATKTASDLGKRMDNGELLTIAVFGDSTMFGYEVGGPTNTTQDPNAPPISLRRTLKHLYGNTMNIINGAISGSNLNSLMYGTDLSPRTPYEARIAPGGLAASADVVYCNHGINHCQSNLSVADYKAKLAEFVAISRRYGKVPILVTPTPIAPIITGDLRESSQIELFVKAMRDVAKATACDLVDNYYYAKKSATRFAETLLVPDGVHPSSDLYLQCGRNLAIPFVSASVLSKSGDLASVAAATHYDTTGATVVNHTETRFGAELSSKRGEAQTGINMAVVLDEPLEYLSFAGLQWINGARIVVGTHGYNAEWGVFSCGKVYGNTSVYDWDTDFVVKTNAMAGLHVLYWIYAISDTRPENNASVFAGVAVPKQETVCAMVPTVMTGTYKKDTALLANYSILFTHTFVFGEANPPTFMEADGTTTMKLILNSSREMRLELYSNTGLVSSTLVTGGVDNNSTLNIQLDIKNDQIVFKTGVVTWGVPLVDSLPPVWLSNKGKMFSIFPS